MTDVLFAFGALALLVAAFVVPVLLRRAAYRRKRYQEAAEIFHGKAAALANDADTPVELLNALSLMNSTIDDPKGVRLFLRFAWQKPTPGSAAEGRAIYEAEVAPFFKRRPELHRAFGDAVMAQFAAWMWNGRGLRGVIARRIFLRVLPMIDGQRVGDDIVGRANLPATLTGKNHFDGRHHAAA